MGKNGRGGIEGYPESVRGFGVQEFDLPYPLNGVEAGRTARFMRLSRRPAYPAALACDRRSAKHVNRGRMRGCRARNRCAELSEDSETGQLTRPADKGRRGS